MVNRCYLPTRRSLASRLDSLLLGCSHLAGSTGLQVESAEDVRIWLSICSEECAGFIRDVIGCVSQFDVLLKGVRCGDA